MEATATRDQLRRATATQHSSTPTVAGASRLHAFANTATAHGWEAAFRTPAIAAGLAFVPAILVLSPRPAGDTAMTQAPIGETPIAT